MTRSEAIERTLDAWDGEPCPHDGRPMRAYHWTDEGEVIAHCPACDRDFWVAWEPWPTVFDPEPDADGDLPF